MAASVVAGALFAGLFVPAVAAMGGRRRAASTGSTTWPCRRSRTASPQQSVLLAADGRTPIARFYAENRQTVPLNKISKNMQNADHRDRGLPLLRPRRRRPDRPGPRRGQRLHRQRHAGPGRLDADPAVHQEPLRRAGGAARRQGGASRPRRPRTPAARSSRSGPAIDLEKKMTKDQILEAYLNIAYFGNRPTASRPPRSATSASTPRSCPIEQSALLAGHRPGARSRTTRSTRRRTRRNRRNTVLARMHELKVISDQQYAKAVKTQDRLKPEAAAGGCITAIEGLGYFCEYVRQMVAQGADAFAKLGSTRQARIDALDRGGLRSRRRSTWTRSRHALQVDRRSTCRSATRARSPRRRSRSSRTRATCWRWPRTRSSTRPAAGTSTEINYSVDANLGGSSGLPDRLDVQGLHARRLAQGRP